MAKINIDFNNTNYNVDESALSSATAALQSHLSTVMNGSGATIALGDTTYNIDSAKLTAATNDFIAHLGTIAGSGSKVVVGGTEYAINSAKLSGAIAEIETVLGGLLSGGSGESDNTNDILCNTQPIEWNTKTVSENNSSFTLSGIQYVKVSNLVLTDDELKTKTFSVARENGTVLNVSSVITGQINGWPTLTSRTAAYQCSILVVPEASELDGASISAGTYAKDMYASKGTEDTISVIDKA